MHFSWQPLFFALVLIFFTHNAYADQIQKHNTNKVEIINLQVQPPTIKVGDTFTINSTIVNNSPNPIYWYGRCGEGLFSVIFDNHVTVSRGVPIACALMVIVGSLNPSEKITATNPDISFVYRATAAGTSNATVTFSYFIKNQTAPNQLEIWKTISKSFLFTIYDNNTRIKTINETVFSPLKQFKSGIAPKDIVCRHNLQLVVKKDGLPTCLKPQTAQKLVERGWGTIISQIREQQFITKNNTTKFTIMSADASSSSTSYNSTVISKIQQLIDSCSYAQIFLSYGLGSETITLNNANNYCKVSISGEIEMGQFSNQCTVPIENMTHWKDWKGTNYPGSVDGISSFCQKRSIIN